MIDDKLLLRNKKIADYALTLFDTLGASVEYDGHSIYYFLLGYNANFLNVNFEDENDVNKRFKSLSYKDKRLFDTSSFNHDYLQKELNIIHLAILHFDENGNEISIEEKIKEIEKYFKKDSYIYESIMDTIKYYYPDDIKMQPVTFSFSGTHDKETKTYNIDFNISINDKIFNDFIFYMVENYIFIDSNYLIKFINNFAQTRHLEVKDISVNETGGASIEKIKSRMDAEEFNYINKKYYFNLSILDKKTADNYEWCGSADIKVNDIRKLLIVYKINSPSKYSYFCKTNNYQKFYGSTKCPNHGIYDHYFKVIIPYLINDNINRLEEKLK